MAAEPRGVTTSWPRQRGTLSALPSRRTALLWGLLTPLVAVATLVAGWAIDVGASGGQVIRNTEIAGVAVGGNSRDTLRERIEAIASALPDREVRIETPGENPYLTTAEAIGLGVDVEETLDAAMDAGRRGALPARPFRWLSSVVSPNTVDLEFAVNAQRAELELRQLEGDALVSPVEPTLELTDGRFVAVAGTVGAGIEPEVLAVALEAAAESTPVDQPIVVSIRQGALEPRLPDSAAEEAADLANLATESGLSVTAGPEVVEVPKETVRGWLVPVEGEDRIDLSIDEDLVETWLDETFGGLTTDPVDASFTVEAGQVRIIESSDGLRCCGDDSVDAIFSAIREGETEVDAVVEVLEPAFSTEDAQALGIIEEVGAPDLFGPTTNHACCQNRVTNIHRIADIVRGYVIPPGETLSINDFVGRRTTENGFVSDGVIYNGVFTQDVGGGISQFITTLFNASLYAGLEFEEYQSHSIYISRYPRGHEATINFPAPDLKVHNPTPYGVLIWPEYTDTSITVRLYSTTWAEVTVGEPTSSPQGNCRRWTTPRTRVLPDGSVLNDSVFAVYRPAEGVNC